MTSAAVADPATLGVVIPSYGRADKVRRAVRSALQRGIDEVVVVDDASPEPVDLEGIGDPRLRLIRHSQNGGVCAARNTGMAEARATHLVFLDDDDALLPWAGWAYRRWIDKVRARGPDCIVVGGILVEGSGRRRHMRRPPSSKPGEIWGLDVHLVRGNRSINTKQAAAIPKALFERAGGWDDALRSRSSSEMFYRLSEIAAVKGIGLPVYRLNCGGHEKLTADPVRRAESHAHIRKKHAKLLTDPARRAAFEAAHANMTKGPNSAAPRPGEGR